MTEERRKSSDQEMIKRSGLVLELSLSISQHTSTAAAVVVVALDKRKRQTSGREIRLPATYAPTTAAAATRES